jgi:hypothetical protein
MRIFHLLLLCASALVGSCTPVRKDANVNLAGYPPAFREGYVDGCESSRRASAQMKNEDRFKHESQYASGWRDGFDICGKRKK